MLLTFSSQAKPGIPCAIVKQEIANRDMCMPLMTLKAGQIAWNRMLSQFQPILLQRYIYNGTPCAFVLRVRYQPTLSHLSFQILQNNASVLVKSDIDPYLELNDFLEKGTRGRSRMDNTQQHESIAERFLVRTANLTTFEHCQIQAIDSVRNQVEAVKSILEKGFLCSYELSVLEMEVDFCQDVDAKWYFVSLHSYKTELTVKRTIPLANMQEMMSRLVVARPQPQLGRISSSPLIKPRSRIGDDLDITPESLLSEIMVDLGVRRP